MTLRALLLVAAAATLASASCTAGEPPHAMRCRGPITNVSSDEEILEFFASDTSVDSYKVRLVAAASPNITGLTITRSVLHMVNLTLSGFTALRSINLSGNKIEECPDGLFADLVNLNVLNLSDNSLARLDDLFDGLVALKCLDLSKNNIGELQPRIFERLGRLQFLNLSRNSLRTLKGEFGELLGLQHLDVSFNRLARVELSQIPSLARLVLEGNSELGAVLLMGTGQRLQTVDASRTGLTQVPAALTHTIRTLYLSGNSIKTIRCGDLDPYPLLQLLDFRSNDLDFVEDDALGRLDCLLIVYLSNNSLPTVPGCLPEKIKVLHLERNKIRTIGGRDFQGLSQLEVLLLNDNKIGAIAPGSFESLGSLITLDLSGNPIAVLDVGSLAGPLGLQVLRLSNVGVIAPEDSFFPLSATEHLVILDLSHSPGLAGQLLGDAAALAAFRELQELDLSHDGLHHVRSDLLHFLPQLRILNMDGNSLDCTQLEWLATWMRRQDDDQYGTITCSSPPELWGTLLIDLQEAEVVATTTREPEARTILPLDDMDNEIIRDPLSDLSHENRIRSNPFITSVEDAFQAAVQPPPNTSAAAAAAKPPSQFKAPPDRQAPPSHRAQVTMVAGGVLGAVGAVAVLAMRWRRRRRRRHTRDAAAAAANAAATDEEANNLGGVTELW